MTDQEMLKKLRDFLTYEQDVTPEMVESENQTAYREALQRQIAMAWEMLEEYLRIKPPRDLWCPVCRIFHRTSIGEKTDAGVATRACPRVPTNDPRYYGSPIYTGDRG